jgi:hypothetical protein
MELSDGMADLEANMMHFQLMHESLARFSESFGSFLYGLNMNAFCVDFPEVSIRLKIRIYYCKKLLITVCGCRHLYRNPFDVSDANNHKRLMRRDLRMKEK